MIWARVLCGKFTGNGGQSYIAVGSFVTVDTDSEGGATFWGEF